MLIPGRKVSTHGWENVRIANQNRKKLITISVQMTEKVWKMNNYNKIIIFRKPQEARRNVTSPQFSK